PAESAAEEREAAALLAEPPAGPCKARGAFFSPRYRQRSPTPSPRAARQRPSRDPAHLSGRRPEVRAMSGKVEAAGIEPAQASAGQNATARRPTPSGEGVTPSVRGVRLLL